MWKMVAFMVCIGISPVQKPECLVYHQIESRERPTEFRTQAECREAGKALADELSEALTQGLGPVPMSIGVRCVPPSSHGMVAT